MGHLPHGVFRGASPTAPLRLPDEDEDLGTGAVWDALLYSTSALAALAVALTSDGPLDLLWGRVAMIGYSVGALVACVFVRRPVTIRTRVILASMVFGAVAVVPTIQHAESRSRSVASHMKSDVLIVEQAAESLLSGRNPYVVVHDAAALAEWPGATKVHFPYLPGILLVGVPRAAAGNAPWTDARVIYLALTLVIAVPSIAWSTASGEGRIRASQVLLVLATGAPLVFTSGKEVAVLALLLAFLVALQRGHTTVSGVCAGLAMTMHQLAWVILPIVALMPRKGSATRIRDVSMFAASIAFAAVAPFLVWDGRAFVEDAVLFPLGFDQPDGGSQFTPGSLVANSVPSSKWLLLLLMSIAIGVCTLAIARRGVWTSSDVARGTGTLLLIALLLAPRARLAYFAFPLNLLLWSRLLQDDNHRHPRAFRPFSSGSGRGTPSTSANALPDVSRRALLPRLWPALSEQLIRGVRGRPSE